MDKNERDVLCALKTDTSFGHDGGGDFSLPDYMPEVKRLLYVNAAVLPEGKYLNGSVIETGGTLSYSVLYVGDGGELSCASFVTEYSADTALACAVENAGEISVDTEIESTSSRVTAPRSISIRSRMKTRLIADEYIGDEENVLDSGGMRATSEDVAHVEKLMLNTVSLVRDHGSVTSNASGEIRTSSGAVPVMCEGSLCITSSSVTEDGTVSVSGEVRVKCIFTYEDGDRKCVRTALPFDAAIPVGNACRGDFSRAWGRVASVGVAPADTDDGTFAVSAEFDIDAEIMRKCESGICSDAYSTDHESENEYRECEILSPVCFETRKTALLCESDVKNQPDGAEIIDVSCVVSGIQTTVSEGKLYAVGMLKARGAAKADGETFLSEAEASFKTELCDLTDDAASQDLQSRVTCSVIDSTGKITDGKLTVTCDVMLSVSVLKKQKMRIVTSVKLGEKQEKREAPCIRVYYPSSDESVWSVCRKYRADRTRLMKNNTFDGDIAPKGKPVIIA